MYATEKGTCNNSVLPRCFLKVGKNLHFIALNMNILKNKDEQILDLKRKMAVSRDRHFYVFIN